MQQGDWHLQRFLRNTNKDLQLGNEGTSRYLDKKILKLVTKPDLDVLAALAQRLSGENLDNRLHKTRQNSKNRLVEPQMAIKQ